MMNGGSRRRIASNLRPVQANFTRADLDNLASCGPPIYPQKAKHSGWSSAITVDPTAFCKALEFLTILIETLSTGLFVPLADFTPAAFLAITLGRTYIPTCSVELEHMPRQADVADLPNFWIRDAAPMKETG